MKPNTTRNWSIQFWGEQDEHHACMVRGTIEHALLHSDEEECELDWEVIRVSITALGK